MLLQYYLNMNHSSGLNSFMLYRCLSCMEIRDVFERVFVMFCQGNLSKWSSEIMKGRDEKQFYKRCDLDNRSISTCSWSIFLLQPTTFSTSLPYLKFNYDPSDFNKFLSLTRLSPEKSLPERIFWNSLMCIHLCEKTKQVYIFRLWLLIVSSILFRHLWL